jgi:hypothetical protein
VTPGNPKPDWLDRLCLRLGKAAADYTFFFVLCSREETAPFKVSRSPSHASSTFFWSTATLFHPVSNVNKKVLRVTKIMNWSFVRRSKRDSFYRNEHMVVDCNHSERLSDKRPIGSTISAMSCGPSVPLKQSNPSASIRGCCCLT